MGGRGSSSGAGRLTSGGRGGIINLEKLPLNIPQEKFTNYALEPIKQPDKATAFREALGYTKENYQDLIENISRNLQKGELKYKGSNDDGDLYEYVMRITGANGRQANVCTAWINDLKKGELRLTSAYITSKKVTKDDAH